MRVRPIRTSVLAKRSKFLLLFMFVLGQVGTHKVKVRGRLIIIGIRRVF